MSDLDASGDGCPHSMSKSRASAPASPASAAPAPRRGRSCRSRWQSLPARTSAARAGSARAEVLPRETEHRPNMWRSGAPRASHAREAAAGSSRRAGRLTLLAGRRGRSPSGSAAGRPMDSPRSPRSRPNRRRHPDTAIAACHPGLGRCSRPRAIPRSSDGHGPAPAGRYRGRSPVRRGASPRPRGATEDQSRTRCRARGTRAAGEASGSPSASLTRGAAQTSRDCRSGGQRRHSCRSLFQRAHVGEPASWRHLATGSLLVCTKGKPRSSRARPGAADAPWPSLATTSAADTPRSGPPCRCALHHVARRPWVEV